jgi:ribosome biogenesis GTPase A
MFKSMKEMEKRMADCDMVIEVRDARAPLSSSNLSIHSVINNKMRLILFNKADLGPSEAEIRKSLGERDQQSDIILLDAKRGNGLAELKAFLQSRAGLSARFRTTGLMAMIAGLPNVGKSTIINSLAAKRTLHNAKHVATVGDRPGVTRHLSSIQVASDPPVRIIDSPGIMIQKIRNIEGEQGSGAASLL